MKKGSFLIIICLAALRLSAQNTEFYIRNLDNTPPGIIQVFSADKQVGGTDSNGNLLLTNKIVYANSIRLMQNEVLLDFEFKDTNVFFILGGKSYRLLLIPKRIEEVVVSATRAGNFSPLAQSQIKSEDIALQNTGRDLPVLLQLQPSVVITSDAGNGVGYTGIRVRGSDATRTNVTVNGVPINDAESQGTFWVNMPDLAGSVGNIQVQRGVGSSTNGAGAFGATVNVQTLSGFKPYGIISNSYGSYNTRKSSIAAGTGLLNNHWTIDMRMSQVHSDGYIDRAFSDLNSYFISVGYISKKWSLKLLNFAGSEHTYQAWYGIPVEKINGDATGMANQYGRNSGYDGAIYRNVSDSLNFFNSKNRTYNYYTYKNETDNYKQSHYHAYFNADLSPFSRINTTLYYTHGAGYFEQYRPNDAVTNYNIQPAIFGTDTLKNSDIIRRQWLQNDLIGINANYNYSRKKIDFTIGGGFNEYMGDHFGEILWARTAPNASYQKHYYDATGDKSDRNVFAKISYQLNKNVYLFGDMQLRTVHHLGYGLENGRDVNFDAHFLFFNPKAGITWERKKGEQIYASLSVGHREPSRSDFVDNKTSETPKPEMMKDYELGWRKSTRKYAFNVNFYFMDYKNQLVLTGAVNDVGTALRTNVDKSYRAGIELSGSALIAGGFSVLGNVTLSKNQIQKIQTSSFSYIDYTSVTETKKNVPISYSPSVTSAATLQYLWKNGFAIHWVHKYVSKQYLDNTNNNTRTIAAYYFSEIWFNKTWKLKNGLQLEAQFQVLNVFNHLYNNNGYTYDYITGTQANPQKVQEVYLFPSAPRNVMGGLVLKF